MNAGAPKVDGMWDASLSARVRPSADKSTLRSKQLLDEFEQLYTIHVVDRDRLEKELDKAAILILARSVRRCDPGCDRLNQGAL
jgi:hypothetical protein